MKIHYLPLLSLFSGVVSHEGATFEKNNLVIYPDAAPIQPRLRRNFRPFPEKMPSIRFPENERDSDEDSNELPIKKPGMRTQPRPLEKRYYLRKNLPPKKNTDMEKNLELMNENADFYENTEEIVSSDKDKQVSIYYNHPFFGRVKRFKENEESKIEDADFYQNKDFFSEELENIEIQ